MKGKKQLVSSMPDHSQSRSNKIFSRSVKGERCTLIHRSGIEHLSSEIRHVSMIQLLHYKFHRDSFVEPQYISACSP
ncbi:hypothetical protein Syun_025640 [Stephania yunnanensis]|uniref:Uncharacterized protein n=1 Tax=Stephania yunnanensis TaxID=152371 RepID=A0AAP0HWC8_9MAGN